MVLCAQAAVVSALSALCEGYYQDETGQVDSQMQGGVFFIMCQKANLDFFCY